MIKFIQLDGDTTHITLYDMYVVKEKGEMEGYFETKSFFTLEDKFLEDALLNKQVKFNLLDKDKTVLCEFNVIIRAVVSNYLLHHDRYYFTTNYESYDFVRQMEAYNGLRYNDENNKRPDRKQQV